MTWLLLAYGIGMFYLAIHHDKLADKAAFARAWIVFAAIPASHFIFVLLSLVIVQVNLVTIWAEGVQWLLLGVSLFLLPAAIVPNDPQIQNLRYYRAKPCPILTRRIALLIPEAVNMGSAIASTGGSRMSVRVL